MPEIKRKRQRRLTDADSLPFVERVVAGDSTAFEGLVRLYEGYVYSTCYSVTANAEDAEDAMQETFLKVYANLKDFRRESSFNTWITRIAINEGLQRLRKRKEVHSIDEPVESDDSFMPRQIEDWHPNPEQLCADRELRELVEQAIARLPADYRVVFVMRDVQGLDTVEIAESLGLTIAAFKSRLLRARLMVREALAERLAQPATMRSRLARSRSMMAMMMDMVAQRIGGVWKR